MLYILDTDHVSLLQHGHPPVVARFLSLSAAERTTTIVSAEEQFQGRLAVIHRAKTQLDAARGYDRLRETLELYTTVQVLPYDLQAAQRFDDLRRQGLRIGTQDLRIACIALSHAATVVTRNARHFAMVPGLATEDWSQPLAS